MLKYHQLEEAWIALQMQPDVKSQHYYYISLLYLHNFECQTRFSRANQIEGNPWPKMMTTQKYVIITNQTKLITMMYTICLTTNKPCVNTPYKQTGSIQSKAEIGVLKCWKSLQ